MVTSQSVKWDLSKLATWPSLLNMRGMCDMLLWQRVISWTHLWQGVDMAQLSCVTIVTTIYSLSELRKCHYFVLITSWCSVNRVAQFPSLFCQFSATVPLLFRHFSDTGVSPSSYHRPWHENLFSDQGNVFFFCNCVPAEGCNVESVTVFTNWPISNVTCA